MATVFKREGSPYYYASFYFHPEGEKSKQIKRPTKERSRVEALKKAQLIEQDYKALTGSGDEKSRLIIEKVKEAAKLAIEGDLNAETAQNLVSQILEISTGESIQSYSIREWCLHWLDLRKPHLKPSTFAFYRGSINAFLLHLGDKADAKLQSLSKKHLITFRNSIVERGRTAKTANHYLKCLSACLERAKKDELVTHNRAYGIEKLPEDDSLNRLPFTKAEAQKLLKNASTNDWKGAILIAYFSGLRILDITNLHWGQIDLEQGIINIIPRKTSRKGTPLTIPLNERVKDFLLAHPCTDEATSPLFPSLAGRAAGGTKGVSTEFIAYMESLNISKTVKILDPQGNETYGLKSFHSLRHSFVSAMANANVSQEHRRKLAGHASDAMNDLYTHTEIETLRQAVDSITL